MVGVPALAVIAIATGGHRSASAACLSPGAHTVHLQSDGRNRVARVRVPVRSVRALLVALHGYRGNGPQMERYTGFDAVVGPAGVAVAYPSSAGSFWNSNGVRTLPDDVSFLGRLIAYLQVRLCPHPEPVFLTGVSNGGGMAALAACRLAGDLRGVASVAGGYDGQPACRSRRPLSLLEIHGTADPVVPYFGAHGRRTPDGLPPFVRGWLRRDGCSGHPAQVRLSRRALQLRWSGCAAGTSVEHVRIAGGRHQWPGALPPDPGPNAGFSATTEIWRFLRTLLPAPQAS
jgi:polyhydroxybutyrate depolymerase